MIARREIQSKQLLEWIAQLLLTLLKSRAFSIHSLLYGKVKKCTRLHFYPGDDHYFDSNSNNFKNYLMPLPENQYFLAFLNFFRFIRITKTTFRPVIGSFN
jgi:hypothetical protein